ncbi:MAG: sensor histidine kinase, partial [Minisyncoccia bacterium]
ALFDHTATYSQEDDSINYVAMAVHELRTPLTLLRGYIEVFEEELAGKLSPDLAGFLTKMKASAQQLVAFTNNVLNIARIEEDQLTLQLSEENWNEIVKNVVDDLKIRTLAKDMVIETNLAPGLPTVAADRTSLYEVLSNLLDNAIKYSGQSHKIIVKTEVVENGVIQTSVQDFGVGIAINILPHLFEKFYRSYHTQTQVGGTGLGLYLSKAIVTAHGGNIWVRSKEGDGTTVGFTIKPYAQLAGELKNSNNKDITRNAYGWIKNHSLYRR